MTCRDRSVARNRMHEAMSAYGVSCLLVNSSNVERSMSDVRKGRINPLVYLDLCSRPGDIFYAFLEVMAAAGVYTLCDPKVLPWMMLPVAAAWPTIWGWAKPYKLLRCCKKTKKMQKREAAKLPRSLLCQPR